MERMSSRRSIMTVAVGAVLGLVACGGEKQPPAGNTPEGASATRM
jgi:hypothetical protein